MRYPKYEVFEWNIHKVPRFEMVPVYKGSSFLKAVFAILKAKIGGCGSVQLEWHSVVNSRITTRCKRPAPMSRINFKVA